MRKWKRKLLEEYTSRDFKKERRTLLKVSSKRFHFNYKQALLRLKRMERKNLTSCKAPNTSIAGLVYLMKKGKIGGDTIGSYFGVNAVTVRNNAEKIEAETWMKRMR